MSNGPKLMAFALMGALMGAGTQSLGWGQSKWIYAPLSPEEVQRAYEAYEKKKKMLMKKQGMKEFEIDGILVMALNKKNAERKIKNILMTINKQTNEQQGTKNQL